MLYGMLDLVNMLDWFIKQGVVSKLTANGVFLAYVLGSGRYSYGRSTLGMVYVVSRVRWMCYILLVW